MNYEQIKAMDYKEAVTKMEASGASEESLRHMRRCWYPTDEERREDEINSKLAEIAMSGKRYSAFE